MLLGARTQAGRGDARTQGYYTAESETELLLCLTADDSLICVRLRAVIDSSETVESC